MGLHHFLKERKLSFKQCYPSPAVARGLLSHDVCLVIDVSFVRFLNLRKIDIIVYVLFIRKLHNVVRETTDMSGIRKISPKYDMF